MDCGKSRRASETARGYVASDDGADAGEAALADHVLAELRDELRDVLPDGAPSESARSWTSVPPGFDVFTRQNRPPPSACTTSRTAERVAAEIRRDRQRVRHGTGAVARLEVRGRVGAGGMPDVTPLGIEDDE